MLAKPANGFLVSIQQIRNPICQLTVSILARAPCVLGPLIASFFDFLPFLTAYILFASLQSVSLWRPGFVCPVNRLGLVAAGCLSIITAKRRQMRVRDEIKLRLRRYVCAEKSILN